MGTAISLLMCIGAGTVGGVFFAFSTFIMKALAELPDSSGVLAMQRINVVVLGPPFLGLFMGTAVVAAAGMVFSVLWATTWTDWLLLGSGLAYLLGSFGVTLIFNVPRNERLRQLDATSQEARAYWRTYLTEWTHWNHVRTAASLLSAACAAGALTG